MPLSKKEKIGIVGGLVGGLAFWYFTRPTTVTVGSGVAQATGYALGAYPQIAKNAHGYIFNIGSQLGTFVAVQLLAPGQAPQSVAWNGQETVTVPYIAGATVAIQTTTSTYAYTMAAS